MVAVEPSGPLGLGVEPVLIRLLRDSCEVAGVPAAEIVGARSLQAFARVFGDRVEHQEAVVPDRLHEAGVHERGQAVEVGVADLLGSLERERAREDGEAGEELL